MKTVASKGKVKTVHLVSFIREMFINGSNEAVLPHATVSINCDSKYKLLHLSVSSNNGGVGYAVATVDALIDGVRRTYFDKTGNVLPEEEDDLRSYYLVDTTWKRGVLIGDFTSPPSYQDIGDYDEEDYLHTLYVDPANELYWARHEIADDGYICLKFAKRDYIIACSKPLIVGKPLIY